VKQRTGGPSSDATPRTRDLADAPLLVSRPRLVRRLRNAVGGALTMLTAPAGFGKTVVLDQWAAEDCGFPITHLTLHPHDEPPAIPRKVAAQLVADRGPSRDRVVVVDTVDAPESDAVAEALGTLIADAPPGLRVVMASRSGWPRLVHHPRLAGVPVVRIDEAELAFTSAEAQRLVRAVAGRELTDPQLEALMERTGGWPVGLHLAAIALRQADDPDTLIANFGGNDRHVAAYLRSEVLEHLPPHVRRFLRCTSVLDHLTAPLCDALTGDSDGATVIRQLEQFGVVTPLPTRRTGRFTYHRMLRESLRDELGRRESDAERGLLIRAGEWHVDSDEPETAARYFIEAQAWDQVIDLVDRWGGPLFERGAAGIALRWLEAVPTSRHPSRLELAMRHAVLLTMVGDTRAADQVLRAAEADGPRRGERVVVNALRATFAFFDAPPESAVTAADAVLEAVDAIAPEEIPDVFGLTTPTSLRAMAAGSRARATWYLGDVTASRRTFASVLRQLDTSPVWLVHVLSALALLEAWAGNLCIADRHANRALTAAARHDLLHHPATMDARLASAHVARERAQLTRADALLDEAWMIATRTRRPITLAIHAVERALWHLAAGHPDRGLAELERQRQSGHPPPPPLIERRRRALEVRLLLALGRLDRAQAILPADLQRQAWDADGAAAAVQACVVREDVVAARARLELWPPHGGPRARLEHDLWAAIVDFETGDRRRALKAAATVVAAGRREGHVRLFLDAGRPAERLLRDLVRTTTDGYVHQVMRSATPVTQSPTDGVLAKLSERELEVVRFLPTPLASTEIAARLYISHNTVKSHLRSIYRKLGVDGRQEAARRAVDLGIA
jgi:LuxR family transcriptional regulator, maltose regulon positive regulatory protein